MTDNTALAGGANPQVKQVLDWMKTQIGQADQVVEEWHDETGFYRKHASGFIEQAGQIPAVTGNSRVKTVSLWIPFATTKYFVAVNNGTSSNNQATYRVCAAWERGTSQFKALEWSLPTDACWYACGY